MSEEIKDFQGWAILELMGHIRLAGMVSQENQFGVAMGRIDIPNTEGFTTQFFGGSSIYRLTPVSEEVARAVALSNKSTPVHRWELPEARTHGEPLAIDDDSFIDDDLDF